VIREEAIESTNPTTSDVSLGPISPSISLRCAALPCLADTCSYCYLHVICSHPTDNDSMRSRCRPTMNH